MRVLYVASKQDSAGSLELEREIMALQLKFADTSGDPVEFRFLPDIRLEALAPQLDEFKPDILHISAHGAPESLSFKDEEDAPVELTAEGLRTFLKFAPPRLLVLSACNSAPVAKKLTDVVAMTIGTTAEITNDAARASAVLLYHSLLRGRDVQTSYDASNALLSAKQTNVKSNLYSGKNVVPAREILRRAPQLVARFSQKEPKPDKKGNYWLDLGVIGCPANTWHVVYFTDDEDVADALEEDEYEEDMCFVSRSTPVRGSTWQEIWADESWPAYGDHALYACGTTTGGQTFTIATTLCEAIDRYYALAGSGKSELPVSVRKAITRLRADGGSKFIAQTS